jgi:hypothetical protein
LAEVATPFEGPRGLQTTGTEEEGEGVGTGNPTVPAEGFGFATTSIAELPATTPVGISQEHKISEDPMMHACV